MVKNCGMGCFVLVLACLLSLFNVEAGASINDQIAQLDIDTARLPDVLEVFGPPEHYGFGDETFDPANLPEHYIMFYPNEFRVVMHSGWIEEYRFEDAAAGYVWLHGIQIGWSLDAVLAQLGEPAETVIGEPSGWEDGVLYKDMPGSPGWCYYRRSDLQVRLWLVNYLVIAIYVTRSDSDTFNPPPSGPPQAYDDVRGMNLSGFDMSGTGGIPATLTYDEATQWPDASHLPAGFDPAQLMEDCKNPGLGVRALHARGITGVGVNVAIIDQPLRTDHPEYAGKIASYYDTGTGLTSSMHGPAVASLLVGTNCGTAPGASLYFAAAPSWTGDSAYYAAALDWIIAQNRLVGSAQKIRVVSVSAAPSGSGSPFTANQQLWDEACARAEAAGIVVLDCTGHRRLIGACWYDMDDPENVSACTPGFPGSSPSWNTADILAPASPRTTAEHDSGRWNCYIHWGRSGLSWAQPYAAGVLALGWQIQPGLPGWRMLDLLEESAHVKPEGHKIIDPMAFIEVVQRQVSCNEPLFVVTGARLCITAANNGTGYQWYRDGEPLTDDAPRMTGVNTCTLTFTSLLEEDSGSYTCVYSDGSKTIIETDPYVLEVSSQDGLPASGAVGMALLVASMGLCIARYTVLNKN